MSMSDMSMTGMDMATSTMADMASSTMSMAMASATSSSDMGGMDMSGHDSSMMGMSSMMMTFFTSTTTPLFSEAWTPSGAGQYAGTCIFIIALSFVLRALIALRVNFNSLWAGYAAKTSTDAFSKDGARGGCSVRRPWRVNEAATRAVLDTVLAGVSYLLCVFLDCRYRFLKLINDVGCWLS